MQHYFPSGRQKSSLGRAMGYLRRSYYLFMLLVLVIVGGTASYVLVEKASVFDAFYMTCITITTVGYREVFELSPAGRIMTILISFSGLTFILIIIAHVGQDMVNTALDRHRRRMDQQIAKLKDHFILCGYGRMGRVIARQLEREKVTFVIVDHDQELVDSLREDGIYALHGDATLDQTLEAAGIREARGLVTVLARDAENVFVVLTGRELNPELFILARASDNEAVPKLYRAGASKVVNPYESAGTRIAQTLLRPVVVDFMEVFATEREEKYSVEEIRVEDSSLLCDRTMRQADIRRHTNAIVVAIKKATGQMLFNPSGDETINANDVLIAIGGADALNRLSDLAKQSTQRAQDRSAHVEA